MNTKKESFDWDLVILVGLLVFIFVVIGFLRYVGGHGNNYSDEAARAVEAQGYTDLELIGMDYLACNDSKAGWAFNATNGNGIRVHVVACSTEGPFNILHGWYLVSK